MGYIGSYVWRIRQKIGHDELITATVDVVATRDGKVCLVYNKDFNAWTLPAGHVELNDSWQSAIKTEMQEEAGLITEEVDLVPFATISGPNYRYEYPNGDKTRPFTLVFLCGRFSEQDLSDSDEILEKRWFDLNDVKSIALTNNASLILSAYKKYNETRAFQQIIV
ncbi:NUDIX domain-containing protein [Candidatus Saccharibacteria bacterium]|nr:NUDIX domain-containing protein [Candidatus Saccharibacteria bacterium]MBR2803013.1 NUDIX domain-containing protein [Candidatus Saccharibacteria bacterium]